MLAILARVMAAEGWRTPTVSLMCLGLLGFLLGDSAWAIVNNNNWSTSDFVETLLGEPFLIAYSLLGAAALHSSATELAAPARDDRERTSPLLLVSLTLASLVAPCILAGEAASGRVIDGIAIAICSALLTALVVVRMTHLLRAVQAP